jgi:hypothetical protein
MTKTENQGASIKPTRFRQFVGTGRFIEANTFLNIHKEEVLHRDCVDVVQYYGCMYIQHLKSGLFYVKPRTYKTLSRAERFVWDKYKEKFINN